MAANMDTSMLILHTCTTLRRQHRGTDCRCLSMPASHLSLQDIGVFRRMSETAFNAQIYRQLKLHSLLLRQIQPGPNLLPPPLPDGQVLATLRYPARDAAVSFPSTPGAPRNAVCDDVP